MSSGIVRRRIVFRINLMRAVRRVEIAGAFAASGQGQSDKHQNENRAFHRNLTFAAATASFTLSGAVPPSLKRLATDASTVKTE